MTRIEVEHVLIHDLKPYEHNPRKNEDAIEAVKASIEKHGFLQPLLIDQDNRICAGHSRWAAAKDLNMIKIPCVRKEMSDGEFIDYNLADNKTGELSKWDNKKLRKCMTLLEEITDIQVPGFQDKDIDKIFGHKHSETHGSSQADFGESGTVDDTIDEEALVKSMTFKLNGKEHRIITSKLQAIKKEHGLRTLADSLLKALENHKGLTDTKIRKGSK